VYESAKICIDD
jgi:alpha-beta hydrolase superfamily lysophospholipase